MVVQHVETTALSEAVQRGDSVPGPVHYNAGPTLSQVAVPTLPPLTSLSLPRNFDLSAYRRVLSDIAVWIYQGITKVMEEEIQPVLVIALLEHEGEMK